MHIHCIYLHYSNAEMLNTFVIWYAGLLVVAAESIDC